MRMSKLFVRTLREAPAEAEIASHRLLIRAGYVRKLMAGVYTWLPLGFRMLRKIAAPNARLYCAMPNRESLCAMYHRETWRMLRPLGHVNYFSRKSVKRAMQSAGFAVELLKATDLWQVRIPRSFGHLIQDLVELLSLGDQWLVVAHRY